MNYEEWMGLLSRGETEALVEALTHAEATAAAGFFECLEPEQATALCRLLKSETVAELLVELSPTWKQHIIAALGSQNLKEVMDEVSVDDTVDIIEEMPSAVGTRIAEEDEIVLLLEQRKFGVLKPLLQSKNATDISLILEEIPRDDVPVVFRILPKDLAAETFVEMDSDLQQALITALSDKELQAVMDELFVDDTVDIIEEMPANVVKRMLAQTDAETRNYVNEILKYPKDSAGSIMTVEFVSLKAFMTVEQAFERIRRTGLDKETIYTCYVTDDRRRLLGVITAKKLLLSDKDAVIGELMEKNVLSVSTTTDKEDVARTINKYGFLALPVVDAEDRLVGIVTVDDAMDILQEENTEDFEKMAAITPNDKPYLKTSVWKLWLNRVPWLLVLMISATFTGIIISYNEETLNMPVIGIILTACIPMLMDTGGNAGSQASVTVIRGIALGEISFGDFFRVLWKEMRVSVLLGATLAAACFAKLMVIDQLWSVPYGFLISFVVCLSMLITIVIAKVIGCMMPLLAKKCRLDPAVVASPFITTIVDALSLIVYCNIAILLLGTLPL